MRRKGKSFSRHGLFSPRYHEVTLSSFRSSTMSTLLYVQHHYSRARSRREQTRTTHIFSTVFIRHFRHDECFSNFLTVSHAHVTLRFLSPFLLYPTRRSVLRPDPAVPRSANCLGSTLLFLSPPQSHSICLFDITLHPSQRFLIDTFRSRPAYIFSNPTLV
jgi:hypothetical protein